MYHAGGVFFYQLLEGLREIRVGNLRGEDSPGGCGSLC